ICVFQPNEEFNRLNEPLQTVATGYCSTNYPVTQTSTEEKLHPDTRENVNQDLKPAETCNVYRVVSNLFDCEEHDEEHGNGIWTIGQLVPPVVLLSLDLETRHHDEKPQDEFNKQRVIAAKSPMG
ncbi:unnamed protein product, partial [Heterotrigona itama]